MIAVIARDREIDDPDFDDLDLDDGPENSLLDEEELYFEFDCHMDRNGLCGKAGSEECDFDCPFRDMKR